jgi:hypothetical protein
MIKAKEKPIIFSTLLIPAIQNLKPGTWPPEPIDSGAAGLDIRRTA